MNHPNPVKIHIYQGLKFALFPSVAERRGKQWEFKARQQRERRPNRPEFSKTETNRKECRLWKI